MASSNSQKFILIALLIAVAAPISTATRDQWTRSEEETAQHVKDLCSKTSRSDDCWRALKPELNRFESSDDRATVGAALDLAIAKSDQIHDKLNQLYADSKNEDLKEKYITCSKNYNDVNRNMVVARSALDSGADKNIPVQVKDAEEELKNCRKEFGEKEGMDLARSVIGWFFGKEVFDPARIRDRNKELGLYLEIVSAALKLIM